MSHERIVVRIAVDGTIRAETLGMRGKKCLDSIALLEGLLDAETVSSAFTPEYIMNQAETTIEGRDELHH
ncbi:DUF2997 domain-containing protein [Intrasporangium calvum]|uniref:DUF2997 domain-containing protein n=1 Tax=Intrasporangium calvum (strain ATCC 23552 / DSM 43043 / JCM 3097 / NBRC 12989 / NCIMB 10167 / NRRL B-3866 / 7 KIP) TaxID=710696 RepID=E6SC25_INTC7|nr:DUF2997 domain-containing protein [Intrasporangium calvum]ADU49565.1 hypothetical protein Intca_3079 [Intrasporangium calvum DSM 43043]